MSLPGWPIYVVLEPGQESLLRSMLAMHGRLRLKDLEAKDIDEFLAMPGVQKFCLVLRPFVGDCFIRELLEGHGDPVRASSEMEAPVTLSATICSRTNAAIDGQPPLVDRDLERLIVCVLEIVQKLNRAAQASCLTAADEAGKAAVGLLAGAKAKAGRDAVGRTVVGEACLGPSLFPPVYSIISMFRATWGVLRGPFETRTTARLAAVKS